MRAGLKGSREQYTSQQDLEMHRTRSASTYATRAPGANSRQSRGSEICVCTYRVAEESNEQQDVTQSDAGSRWLVAHLSVRLDCTLMDACGLAALILWRYQHPFGAKLCIFGGRLKLTDVRRKLTSTVLLRPEFAAHMGQAQRSVSSFANGPYTRPAFAGRPWIWQYEDICHVSFACVHRAHS